MKKKKKSSEGFVDAQIVSYTLFSKKPSFVPIVILDEAHYIKNPKSKRSKILRKFLRKAPHKLLLTGTPVKNRPFELWALLNMINKGPTWSEWIRRYCDCKKNPFGGVDFRGATLQKEMWTFAKKFMVEERVKMYSICLPRGGSSSPASQRVPQSRKVIFEVEVDQSTRNDPIARKRKEENYHSPLYMTGDLKRDAILHFLKGGVSISLLRRAHQTSRRSPERISRLHVPARGVESKQREKVVRRIPRGKVQVSLSLQVLARRDSRSRAPQDVYRGVSLSPGRFRTSRKSNLENRSNRNLLHRIPTLPQYSRRLDLEKFKKENSKYSINLRVPLSIYYP